MNLKVRYRCMKLLCEDDNLLLRNDCAKKRFLNSLSRIVFLYSDTG